MENIIINNDNNEVILNFNMNLYRFYAVISAAKEFTNNFWVNIDKNTISMIKVSLKPKEEFVNDVDLSELGYEFYNLALASMQSPILP